MRWSSLQVVASLNRDVGGPARSVPGLSAALAALGVETTIVSLNYANHGAPLDLPGAKSLHVIPSAVGRGLRGWSPSLRGLILKEAGKAHVIHSHALWMVPGIYARQAAERFGKPLVISPRGMLDSWSLARGRLKKRLAAWAYENRNLGAARLLHATSEAEAESIRHFGLKQPIAVLPNGVNTLSGPPPPRELLERRFPSLCGRRWLLFLGRLDPKKGVDLLLDLWAEMGPQLGDWSLVLAGPDLEGFGKRMARRVAAEAALRERVIFTGMLEGEEKVAALAGAELFVLPTHGENFGIAVAEALAHGTPVVTTRAAPWQELVEHNCGWWVEPPPAIEPFRAALETALRLSPEELRDMGARGRALISDKYAWPAIGARWVLTYRWLLAGGTRPPWVL